MPLSDNNYDVVKIYKREKLLQVRNASISLAVMLLLSLAVYFFKIPNPNMILIAGLTVFTSMFGYPAGVVCGAEMILYSMFFFSTDHSFFDFTPENLQKVAVVVLGVVLNVAFIGHLKKRHNEATRRLEELNISLLEDNHTLEEASTKDALTTVRNRYALRRDYERYKDRYLHVMMIDLDGFKKINDDNGHAAGDHLLKQTGVVLKETFGSDCVYRYGGDEFLIVCPEVSEDNFTERVDEIRSGLHRVNTGSALLPVGLSGGYVYGRNERENDLRNMIHQADELLYRAKRHGKDFCIGAEYDPLREPVSPKGRRQ